MKKQLALMALIGAFSVGAHAQIKSSGGDGDDKTGPASNASNPVRDNAQGKSHATRAAERKEKRAMDAGAMGKSSGGDGDDKSGPASNASNPVRDNAQGKSHATRAAERKEKRAMDAGAMGKSSGGDGDDKSIPVNNPDMKGNAGSKR